MQPFNYGLPLQVVRTCDGKLGVVDETRRKVWHDYELMSKSDAGPQSVVQVPEMPEHYGAWNHTSIGGLSETIRRTGIIQANPKCKDPVVLFSTHTPECITNITKTLDAFLIGYAVGDAEHMEGYGVVVEFIVYDPSHVARTAATIARFGATPLLEDSKVDARRPIGIERLDRIDAKAVSGGTNLESSNIEAYGVRRGRENWRFPWIPDTWTRVPLTIDHMVENLLDENITHIPQPFCQHVAQRRLELGLYNRMGTLWVRSEHPPTQHELMVRGEVRYPHRIVFDNESLRDRLSRGESTVTVQELEEWGLTYVNHARYLIQTHDGLWYRPRDTRNQLMSFIPNQRIVSCALSVEQSKQLCTCFYLLLVEGIRDVEVCRAVHLIFFRYMIERGYTSRCMGKYTQDAMHIGNGNEFRPFRRLSQYAPERVPIEVLSKLCGRDGRMQNRGSKGTRSKYRFTNRYRPSRRLKRTREDEDAMVSTVL